MPDDDGLTFDGYPQPPTVPPDPVGDEWRGEAGPAGPAGPTGATGATGPAGAPGGVTTFNTRTGAITLLSADVTSALTFTPYDAANPSGYQTAANVTTKLTAPGAIGGTTPGSGAFTTLSASSTISGAGFTSWLASPPAIGGTAPAAGAFTTLSATSTISGTGFTNWLASPPAIGGTTAAAGTFSTLAVAGTAGSFRNVDFRSGASLRMRLSLNNTAEGGANAGSDLDLFTFTDAGGALVSPAIRINRASGAAQFFAGMTVTSLTASGSLVSTATSSTFGSNAGANETVGLNSAAGGNRVIGFQTAGLTRWNLVGANATAEGGSNAGSDFTLNRHDDAGAFISQPLIVTRSTGAVAITGTNTNNNAAAGQVGEVLSAALAVGSAVPLTSAVTANVLTLTLTAGDWDVTGSVAYNLGGTTNVTSVQVGISTTSASMPPTGGTTGGAMQVIAATLATGYPIALTPGTARMSLSASTTVYLVAQLGFTVSTAAAYGSIWARRAR